MVVSKDFTRSGKAFSQSASLLKEFQIFSESINLFLSDIDPAQYASLKKARALAEDKYPFVQMLDRFDPLLMEGQAIMWNRTTPDHKDLRDPKVGWAALVVLGNITSGWLIFRQLNLKVRYQSGDMVWLRGAILDHEVDVWEGEHRICVAHFTHQSYFHDLGLACETVPGVPPTDPLQAPPSRYLPPAPSGCSSQVFSPQSSRKRKRRKVQR
jgi:hypothetical protein